MDDTIASRSGINCDDLVFFKKDRNINGGAVLIGVCNLSHPKGIKLKYCESESLYVRVDDRVIVWCYYRPHRSIDITNFTKSFHQITMHPKDHFILVRHELFLV